MWVMIIKQIPVEKKFKPQKMGIYWGTPWVNLKWAVKQFALFTGYDETLHKKHDISAFQQRKKIKLDLVLSAIPQHVFENIHLTSLYPEDWREALEDYKNTPLIQVPMGQEPNQCLALKIIVESEPVRIWPYEYSIMTPDKVKSYVEQGTHTFQESRTSEDQILADAAFGNYKKEVYEAALLDGCTDYEAKLTALGLDFIDKYELPPIGWYKCKEQYASYFAEIGESR